ncbi:MAG: protein kinase [Candidatus Solibacter usitatus]|nr:protein kinase [Candidatus Solibacter usitatus]
MDSGTEQTSAPDPDKTQLLSDLPPHLAQPFDPDKTQVIDPKLHVATGWTRTFQPKAQKPVSFDKITPGTLLGDRYEIIRLLGEGGMGAVFEARDREVDRIVALKIIQPSMASNPAILRMFKQELVLASKVTHRNVIRIYDLGMVDEMRFITMQFVKGTDLSTMIEEKSKLPPEQAANIIMQVCEGLDAAHQEKVVHRDLKPQNIMVDGEGRVLVMDFGLAQSIETGTGKGVLQGTPLYMSPEQANREEVDARSDLFAVGIIFYQLLLGELPFDGPTLEKKLQSRITDAAPVPIEKDPAIPKPLSDMIGKCLAKKREERYQSAAELVYDLQVWLGIIVPSNTKLWKRVTLASAVLVLAATGITVTTIMRRPTAAPKPVTMLVADFTNQTGEAVLDGTLEPLIGVAMEGASFINNYNRETARTTARQIQAGAKVLDENLARLVAQREGLNVVLAGVISRSGTDYALSAKAVDAVTGKSVSESLVKAPNKEKLLSSISKLTQPIRKSLGDRMTSSSKAEEGETFTAASLEAAQSYSLGQQAQLSGDNDEALRLYRKALSLDPKIGRAYSGMGVIYRNLRQRDEAEASLKTAISMIGQMSQRERYRTRGAYYVTIGNYEKAADEFKTLVKQFPADNVGYANLAICYLYLRNLPGAIEEGRKAVDIYPKNFRQRNNLASYLLYAGKFDQATREADEVLKLNPRIERAYVAKALAALAEGKPELASAAYEKAGAINARGASYRSLGLADMAMVEGRNADAVELLQAGIKADLAAKQKEWAAEKQAALAQALLLSGKRPAAIAAAGDVLKAIKDEGILFLAAQVLVDAGQEAQARAVAQTLSKRLENEPQAYGKLIEGELALKKGEARDAIKLIQESQKLRDTWISRFHLGRAYLAAEAYTEADSEFDACLRRRGEATSLVVDLLPTYSYFPPVHYYIGRVQQALGSPNATQSYKTFLGMRAKAGTSDPQVADARKRAGL